jgi:hypothetical protein
VICWLDEWVQLFAFHEKRHHEKVSIDFTQPKKLDFSSLRSCSPWRPHVNVTILQARFLENVCLSSKLPWMRFKFNLSSLFVCDLRYSTVMCKV